MECSIDYVFQNSEKKEYKQKVPKNVKNKFGKKKKLSQKILNCRSKSKISKLRTEFCQLEDELKMSYGEFRMEKELKVINSLDQDPGAFYRFAKSKSVIKSAIGPLKDVKGELKTDKKSISEILASWC